MKRKLNKELSETLALARRLGTNSLSEDQKVLVREYRQ